MLSRDRLRAALEERAQDFRSFETQRAAQLDALAHAFSELAKAGAEPVLRELAGLEAPGAFPSSEWDGTGISIFPFQWQDHAAARAWAYEVLRDRPTFAVDGSQIEPDSRFSLPVGLVQVGWFENRHRPSGNSYTKDVELRVLTPEELREDELGPPKRKLDLARFELEIDALRRYLVASQEKGRLAFFDGSLIASFAEKRKQDRYAARYVEKIMQLLNEAEQARVPLIAYVDTSYARDLVGMLAAWRELPAPEGLSDGAILSGMMVWGDRTPTLRCARQGILETYGKWADRIGFCYMQTNQDAPPVRLEYPLWMLEDGLMPEVLDVVRADVIAGGGYPYTLATADATAVLTMQDREAFYRVLQEFLARREIPLGFSKKALSKLRRR